MVQVYLYRGSGIFEFLDDLLGLWVYTLLFDKIYYTHDSDFLCVTVFCLSALLTAFMRFSGLVYAHNGVRRGFAVAVRA